MYRHHYTLTELEEKMLPWEREIYISLLLEELKKEQKLNERRK